MHVAEAFLPLKVCLEAAPRNITATAVAQTIRACTAALSAKPYQARREAADTLRVLAASIAASGSLDDARRALAAQRDDIVSALQVSSFGISHEQVDVSSHREHVMTHMMALIRSGCAFEKCFSASYHKS